MITRTACHSDRVSTGATNDEAVGEQLFLGNLSLITSIARRVARSQRLPASQVDDFVADVLLKLIDRQYAVLGQFRGQSSLGTFLNVVVRRIGLDLRVAAWGKWRPSASSRRAGSLVMLLERLTMRDQLPFAEACALLARTEGVSVDSRSLESHHRNFVPRQRVRFVGADEIDVEPIESSTADTGVLDAQAGSTLDHALAVLSTLFASFAPEDRALLTLHFRDGWTVASIARHLKLDQKPLHRRYSSLLKQLRRALEQSRISRCDVLWAVSRHCQHAASLFQGSDSELQCGLAG